MEFIVEHAHNGVFLPHHISDVVQKGLLPVCGLGLQQLRSKKKIKDSDLTRGCKKQYKTWFIIEAFGLVCVLGA